MLRPACLMLVALLFCSCKNDNPVDPEPEIKVKDFLPLKIGNKWIYNYDYSGWNNGYGRELAGEMSWLIAAQQVRNDTTFHNVVTSFSGTEIFINTWIGANDTTFHTETAGRFKIIETIDDVATIEFWFWKDLSGFPTREVRMDTLILRGNSLSQQSYVKDIGLIAGEIGVGTLTSISQNLRLVKYELH